MTDEQNNSAEKGSRNFGNIPILQDEDSLPKKAARRKTKPTHLARRRPEITNAPSGNRLGTAKKRTIPYLALLCIPVAFFVLYLAATRYLVPVLIKGPLATQLSQRLNRPVSVGDVSFSSFSFRLRIQNFTIGPDPSRKDDPELCRAAVLDGRVRPTPLLQGKVVLEDVHFEQLRANLVRYRDGSYNILSTRSAGGSEKAMDYSNLLPPWLLVQGLHLTDSTIIFHDLPAGKEHRIGQIQFSLPAAGPEKTVEPTLSAMVDSSPILIRSQRHTTKDGRTETRLSLQLKGLNPQQYLAYLPGAANSLAVTDGNTDAELYITFQDNKQPGSSLTVTGKVTLSDLVLQDKNKTFQLKVSTAQMVLLAKPLQHLYTIEDFVIDTPQVTLTNDQPYSLMNIHTRLASFLKPAGFELEIDRLQIDNGSLNNDDRKGYQDLHILLTGFQNQITTESRSTGSRPAHLAVTANSGDSTIAFQGQVNSSLTPTGKISLQNMDTGLLQPYLPTADGVRFSQGKIELAGTLQTKQEEGKLPVWEITDSSLRIQNFSLHRKDSPLIGGQELSGRECRVQLDKQHIFCRRLNFDNAHFTDKAATFLFGDRHETIDKNRPFSFNNLTIINSTALVPLSQASNDGKEPQIKLSDLSLKLTGMDQEQPGPENLSIQAAVGKQGKVELSGRIQRNGQGMVQFSVTDIDITPLTPLFSSWFALPVHQGTLQLKGRLKLPDNKFIGSFQLDDFTAEKTEGPAVLWQHASGTGVTARLTPFSAAIKELSLQQPTIRLSQGNSSLPSGFLEFFKKENNAPVLPPVKIEQCTINNGSLQRKPVPPASQHLTEFSRVEGALSPLQAATQSSFNLSGRMNAADFTITGRTGINSSENYELEVNHFPLAPFIPLFSQSLGIDVQNGVADWHFSASSLDSDWIRLTGLVPMPDSDLSMTLALLTDKKGSFSLPVPLESAGDPARLFEQVTTGQLRQLRLQAVISTRLVLDKFLPELNLPRDIEFLPGETVPDFMEGLEDYAALLELRPHLSMILRGNYDEKTDRHYLLQVLQEAEDAQRELENLRREELRTKLLAAEQQYLASLTKQGIPANREELHQIEQQPDLQPLPREIVRLPANRLQDLARQRAEVTRSYLTDQLRIPADRIEIQESIPGGTKTELMLEPLW